MPILIKVMKLWQNFSPSFLILINNFQIIIKLKLYKNEIIVHKNIFIVFIFS